MLNMTSARTLKLGEYAMISLSVQRLEAACQGRIPGSDASADHLSGPLALQLNEPHTKHCSLQQKLGRADAGERAASYQIE